MTTNTKLRLTRELLTEQLELNAIKDWEGVRLVLRSFAMKERVNSQEITAFKI